MIVYKIGLKDCPRCLSMKGHDEKILRSPVTEVDFDTEPRNGYVFQLLERISEEHNLTSLSFPFYILDSPNRVDFISGVLNPEDLKTRYKELLTTHTTKVITDV